MAQGDFTKEECDAIAEAFTEVFEALPNVVSFHQKPCDLGELRAAVAKALESAS